jgi:signal transduction histidine kinase
MAGVEPALTGLVVNLLGFLTGTVLYVMLLVMVWRERRAEARTDASARTQLPLVTGICGVVWNVGALTSFGLPLLGLPRPPSLVVALSFSALGFLPAAVVHALLEGRERVAGSRFAGFGTRAAYALSLTAAVLHVAATLRGMPVPSPVALWLLTVGFLALMAVLLLGTRQTTVGRRGIWVAALAIFAVTAAHFGRHEGDEQWWVELAGHHASLPLALAILHQDYRFALADLFLKNAIAVLLAMGVALGVFSGVIAPVLDWRAPSGSLDPRATIVLLACWVATALVFPLLRRVATAMVDRAVLKRSDYRRSLSELGSALDAADSEPAVVRALEATLAATVGTLGLSPVPDDGDADDQRSVIVGPAASLRSGEAAAAGLLRLQTVEPPHPTFLMKPLGQGRRLLSDDVHLIEHAVRLATRRIDALRVAEERLQRSLHEQAIRQLATEAQLMALRAQLNPHFLFNALTTVGYLIRQAPPRALETLLRLTGVLRAVLRRSANEFSTLSEELDLVLDYLEIERARFEDRLNVRLEVAPGLADLRVPALILQPLVENAVKHGISPLARGGDLTVRASAAAERLRLEVLDTGAGFDADRVGVSGVGLENLRRRLDVQFGPDASLTITSARGLGTCAVVELPIDRTSAALSPERAASGHVA